MKPPIRIAVLHFSHKTVTFLPNDTELADLDQPFMGTVRLDGLPYRHVDLKAFYPYENPAYAIA